MPRHAEQEDFWAGRFGDEYTARNDGAKSASNIVLFSKVLARAGRIGSLLELGANVGDNIRAMRSLMPELRVSAVEINGRAAARLRELGDVNVFEGSIFDYAPQPHDLVLLKGVLIHISPEHLPVVYDKAFAACARYICLCEYYNPTPVEVPYRGHAGKLFKRDFAGEMLDRYPLRLVDYGFAYHRDAFPQDDATWFLLERLGG